jgi:hypothetical protein
MPRSYTKRKKVGRAKKTMRGGEDGLIDFKVKVILTNKDDKKKPASFVYKHSKEIIDWIVEQNLHKPPRAIALTRAKGDEINVRRRYNPKLTKDEAKKAALGYFVDGKITIDEKTYDIKIVEA